MKVLASIVLIIIILILVFGVDIFPCPVYKTTYFLPHFDTFCKGDKKVTLFDYIRFFVAKYQGTI